MRHENWYHSKLFLNWLFVWNGVKFWLKYNLRRKRKLRGGVTSEDTTRSFDKGGRRVTRVGYLYFTQPTVLSEIFPFFLEFFVFVLSVSINSIWVVQSFHFDNYTGFSQPSIGLFQRAGSFWIEEVSRTEPEALVKDSWTQTVLNSGQFWDSDFGTQNSLTFKLMSFEHW